MLSRWRNCLSTHPMIIRDSKHPSATEFLLKAISEGPRICSNHVTVLSSADTSRRQGELRCDVICWK